MGSWLCLCRSINTHVTLPGLLPAMARQVSTQVDASGVDKPLCSFRLRLQEWGILFAVRAPLGGLLDKTSTTYTSPSSVWPMLGRQEKFVFVSSSLASLLMMAVGSLDFARPQSPSIWFSRLQRTHCRPSNGLMGTPVTRGDCPPPYLRDKEGQVGWRWKIQNAAILTQEIPSHISFSPSDSLVHP